MKRFFSEKNIAAILFIMVVVIFSFAQKESKKIEHLYINTSVAPHYTNVAGNQLIQDSSHQRIQ